MLGSSISERTSKKQRAVWTSIVLLAWLSVMFGLVFSPLGDRISGHTTLPALFRLRSLLVNDTPLSPRLKILSFDDGTVASLKTSDLYIQDWAALLAAIDARKPQAIIIDKLFSIMFDPMDQASVATERLANVKTPIAAGAFVRRSEIKGRYPLIASQSRLHVSADSHGHKSLAESFPDCSAWHAYGPAPDFSKIFSRVGHINVGEVGWIQAFFRINHQELLPYLGLVASHDPIRVTDEILVDGSPVPTDGTGRVLVNFSPRTAYFDRHVRLSSVLRNAKGHVPLDFIEAGDIVLILPNMYTGSGDIQQTPLGEMPGGFIVAAVLNSLITHDWLTPVGWQSAQILLAAMIGSFIGFSQGALAFWRLFVLIGLSYFGFSAYLFSVHGLVVFWFFPLLSFGGVSLSVFAVRSLYEERRTRKLGMELQDAAEIAKAFRPSPVPKWEGFEIAAYHKPYERGSGDWYSFAASKSGHLRHFMMCDIVGHGVQAALIVSTCKALLSTLKQDREEYLEDVNFVVKYCTLLDGLLWEQGQGKHVVSFLGLTFEPKKHVLRYLHAGHPPAIYVDKNRSSGRFQFEPLLGAHSLLGIHGESSFGLQEREFFPGDELVSYTDGLPMLRNFRAFQVFLNERKSPWPHMAKDLFDHIWEAEFKKKNSRALTDDVSVVCFRV